MRKIVLFDAECPDDIEIVLVDDSTEQTVRKAAAHMGLQVRDATGHEDPDFDEGDAVEWLAHAARKGDLPSDFEGLEALDFE